MPSPCPPVVVTLPAAMIRGPTTQPFATASRMARFSLSPAPQSRTVVKPAISVFFAYVVARSATSAGFRKKRSAYPAAPDCSLLMWTCMSISPGMSVAVRRSTTASPAAGAVNPSAMPTMRSPSTVTVTVVRTVSARPSIRRPA